MTEFIAVRNAETNTDTRLNAGLIVSYAASEEYTDQTIIYMADGAILRAACTPGEVDQKLQYPTIRVG